MELKQIKELMAAMVRCGTTKLHIKKGSFELELHRGNDMQAYQLHEIGEGEDKPLHRGSAPKRSPVVLPTSSDMGLHSNELPAPLESPGIYITSPMVGTFYIASSPEEPPFVKVGDVVEKGTVVCIIEAMKVMNEIKAQVSGTIVEICVDNGHPVEFGAKLFRITAL